MANTFHSNSTYYQDPKEYNLEKDTKIEKRDLRRKRLAIHQAVLEVCEEKGVGNASTAEIARRAGIAAGTLFCYYATKHGLINAVYKDIINRVTVFVNKELRTVPEYNKERQLRKVWQAHVEWYKQHPLEMNFIWMVINLNGESSPYIDNETIEELSICYDEVKKLFQVSIAQEILKQLPPMLLLRIFITNTLVVASLFQSSGSVAAFLQETPQVLDTLENAAWDMIVSRTTSKIERLIVEK